MSELSKISGFTVLPFDVNQIDKIADTYIKIFNADPWNESWSIDRATKRLTQVAGIPDSTGIVVWGADGSVVGFAVGAYEAWDKGDQFYLKELGVRPDMQRQEIGSQILEQIIAAAFKQNASQIVLDTQRNIPAYRLFERFKFKETDRAMMFHKNPSCG